MADDKHPITYLEIDLDQCSLDYGTAPCGAILGTSGQRKCFRSFATCQSPDDFERQALTLRFYPNVSGLPRGPRAYPALESINERSNAVNLSGTDPDMSPFGEPSKMRAAVGDFADSDRGVDPYWTERVSGAAQASGVGYKPGQRASFAPLLLARWPFYNGRQVRVVEGYLVDGAILDTVTRFYQLTKVNYDEGSGQLTIEGKDDLDKLSKNRWLVPAPSPGKLAADVPAPEDNPASFTLDVDADADDYAATGLVNIGNELIRYSRTGNVFTILERAARGSTGKTHNAEDAVQQALEIDGRPDVVLNSLLVDNGPLTSANVPLATLWEDEASVWLAGVRFVTVLAKPTPGAELLAEIAMLGITVYWKLVSQTVGLKTTRPIGDDTLWTITDRDIKSIRRMTQEEERLTEVYFRHVQIDPTQGLEDTNFLRAEYPIDVRAKNPNAWGDTKIKRHNVRWFNQGASDVVRINAVRYLQRFSNDPATIVVVVDGGKYRNVELTDFVAVTSDGLVDDIGAPLARFYQVVRRKEVKQGHDVEITLRLFTQVIRAAYIAPDDAPEYSAATDDEKEDMAFIGPDADDFFADGRPLYQII